APPGLARELVAPGPAGRHGPGHRSLDAGVERSGGPRFWLKARGAGVLCLGACLLDFPFFSPRRISAELSARGGAVRKRLGQNFLIDSNYCVRIGEQVEKL